MAAAFPGLPEALGDSRTPVDVNALAKITDTVSIPHDLLRLIKQLIHS